MRRVMTTLAVVVALGAVPATGLAHEEGGDVPGDLFVQIARSGSLGADAEGQLTLRLEDVDPRVVYFRDRPGRVAGTFPTDALVAAAFASTEDPNATLLIEGDGAAGVVPLELSAPSVEDGAIVYRVSLLEAAPGSFEAYEALDVGAELDFGEAALFIDSGGTTYRILAGSRINVPWSQYPALVTNLGPSELSVEQPSGRIAVPSGTFAVVGPPASGDLVIDNPVTGRDTTFILQAQPPN